MNEIEICKYCRKKIKQINNEWYHEETKIKQCDNSTTASPTLDNPCYARIRIKTYGEGSNSVKTFYCTLEKNHWQDHTFLIREYVYEIFIEVNK